MKHLFFILFFIIIIIATNSFVNKNKEHFVIFDYTGKKELLDNEPDCKKKYECAKYNECSVDLVSKMQKKENHIYTSLSSLRYTKKIANGVNNILTMETVKKSCLCFNSKYPAICKHKKT